MKKQTLDINAFWHDILAKNREALARYFCDGAVIRWHCTNEQFTVEEYVSANCDYPGEWDGNVERIEEAGHTVILEGHVFPADRSASFHVVNFITLEDGRISALDEYWADDGDPPAWRREKIPGKSIWRG